MPAVPYFPIYTAQRCRLDGTLTGAVHYSSNGDDTFCGRKINHYWMILTNDFTGIATCPKCKRIAGANRKP